MKERPILFSTDMVKAILDGRKTMTRRVVSFKDAWPFNNSNSWPYVKQLDDGTWMWADSPDFNYPKNYMKNGIKCPYGQVGDRLWVREKWGELGWHKGEIPIHKIKDYEGCERDIIYYQEIIEQCPDFLWFGEDESIEYRKDGGEVTHWKSSMFIPRWASRITLEITNIRVERVQDITEDDAEKEGDPKQGLIASENDHTTWFQHLWDSINGKKYPWESNPWTWVIEFKKLNI